MYTNGLQVLEGNAQRFRNNLINSQITHPKNRNQYVSVEKRQAIRRFPIFPDFSDLSSNKKTY